MTYFEIDQTYFSNFPELESERLLFRKYTMEDATALQNFRSDDMVMKYMDTTRLETKEDAEEFIKTNLDTYRNGEGLFWAIIDKSNGKFIGDFAYWNIIKKHCRGEIGYTLLPDYWGKGYMTETMMCLVRFGFHRLHLHSIEANVNVENKNSKKLLLKMGFEKEAHFKENFLFDGKFLDSEIYCLLERGFPFKNLST